MVDDAMRALERAAAQGDPEAKDRLERARARAGLHEGSAAVEAELEALLAADAAAVASIRREGSAAFRRWVEAVFSAEPGLQVAIVRGHTPSYNDGDICEHEQSANFGRSAPTSGEKDWCGRAAANTIERERAEGYEEQGGRFAGVLELEHGTDWQLTLRRGPAGVTIERSEPGPTT